MAKDRVEAIGCFELGHLLLGKLYLKRRHGLLQMISLGGSLRLTQALLGIRQA